MKFYDKRCRYDFSDAEDTDFGKFSNVSPNNFGGYPSQKTVCGCDVCGPTSCTVMTRLDGYNFCTDCSDAYFNDTPADTEGWVARRQAEAIRDREMASCLDQTFARALCRDCGLESVFGALCRSCSMVQGMCQACGTDKKMRGYSICEPCHEEWRKENRAGYRTNLDLNQFMASRRGGFADKPCECGTDAAGGGVHSAWCPKC